MFNELRYFFASQKLFSALFAIFAGYLIVFLLGHFMNNSLLALLQIISGLFLVFIGTGISTTIIIQWLIKRNFDQWEFVSLSLLGGLLIAPAILVAEFFFLGKVHGWYPLTNALIFWIGAGIILFFKKTSFPAISFPTKSTLRHPLFIVLAFGLVFTFVQTILYYALPDLDPYRWLMTYSHKFTNRQLDIAGRSFFSAFVFIGTQMTGLNIFSLFK
jgi:hypothetical protein